MSLMQAAFALGLFLIAGLGSLLPRLRTAKPRISQWRWWHWVLLIVFSLLPAQLFLYLAPWEYDFYFMYSVCLALTSISFGIFLAIAVISALVKNRRLAREERTGGFRASLTALRVLLPPTLAVLMLSSIVFGLLAQQAPARSKAEMKKFLQQGEVKYFRLGQ
jgi:hypothetical protein